MSAPALQGLFQVAKRFYLLLQAARCLNSPVQHTCTTPLPLPFMQGLFRVAKRFYLLFQQHTTHEFNARKGELFGDGWVGSRAAC